MSNLSNPSFQFEADDDRRAAAECELSSLERDAELAAYHEQIETERLEAQMEYDAQSRDEAGAVIAMPRLKPVAATCRPVPVKMLGDFEGVFDKPVRPTIAARVATALHQQL